MRLLESVTLLTLFASPALLRAQDTTAKTPAPAGITTLKGVYTEQQASRGEKIYLSSCVACHLDTDHTGATFKQNWDTRTTFDLFEIIRTTMPNDDPGRLPREDYAAIVAYLLKVNQMPSGKQALPSDSTGLRQIVIAVKDAPPQH